MKTSNREKFGKAVLIHVRFNPELGRLEYACEYGIEGWWIIIPEAVNDDEKTSRR